MSDDYIDEILNGKPPQQGPRPKHKLTVQVDHDLWLQALPLLDRKFGALLEGAIREALVRAGKIKK